MEKGFYKYSVEQRDIDFSGRATHVAIINYLLQAAGDDADNKGFGVSDLNQGNCSWVLTRLAIEFMRRPRGAEQVTVATWVSGVNRMGTVRNMTVTGADGEVLAQAVTQWAVIDLDKRVAINLAAAVNCTFALVDEQPPVAMPAKVASIVAERETEHNVVYSDIDFNRHVNAACYMEWMFDMLPLEYFEERELGRFDVNFISEARYGEKVTIGCLSEGMESFVFSVTSADGGTFCRGSMLWGPAGGSGNQLLKE